MDKAHEPAKRFYETLLATEWVSPSELRRYQEVLLRRLIAHAAKSDFYRDRLKPLLPEYGSFRWDAWRQLPTLDRGALASNLDRIRISELPSTLGAVNAIQSGGSTGRPLHLSLSDIEALARAVVTFRMFAAYGFDQAQPLLMIRRPQHGSGRTDRLAYRRWGFPWMCESELGLRIHMDISTPVAEQLAAIEMSEPVYLNTLPSNLLRLSLEAERVKKHPSVPFIISVAEYLAPETRQFVEQSFGGRLIDILSSAEAGIIAIECPTGGKYHIQSEMVLAEILNPQGDPCEAGEIGELVVTPFYNYVNPLIRYRSGDFVVAGGSCACGRALPTIERIEGREGHMFLHPDGSKGLPAVDRVQISRALGHDEWQIVQTSRTSVELRFAGAEPDKRKRDYLNDLTKNGIGCHFAIELKPGITIPLTSGGKRHYLGNEIQPP
jgi:phenylacetate-CoA ligase